MILDLTLPDMDGLRLLRALRERHGAHMPAVVIYTARSLSDEDTRRAVACVAPAMLFPYARAVVTQLVAQGGFPQLLLPPVNFDALYARSLAESQEAVKN